MLAVSKALTTTAWSEESLERASVLAHQAILISSDPSWQAHYDLARVSAFSCDYPAALNSLGLAMQIDPRAVYAEARQDPLVRQHLDAAFARLALDDPDGYFRIAIGRYSLSHVVNGVATFEGKRTGGTLPAGVDARYLLGIVRHLAEEDEVREVALGSLAGPPRRS
jgi:hypothetical protein